MNIFALLCVAFTIGVLVGEHQRGKGAFFFNWYGNELYYGEVVKFKEGAPYSEFYNDCKKITVKGLEYAPVKGALVLLKDCGPGMDEFSLDVVPQEVLEKK